MPDPQRAVVRFDCIGTATGKMRNDMEVRMVTPFEERFEMATDEGPFHGGDATAPPPLAHFVTALTGCIMTQIRAFARRMGVSLKDLRVETSVEWDWEAKGRIYETAPKSFAIDVMLDSDDAPDKVDALVAAAKKGCFIEQTLGRPNTVRHRIRNPDGSWRAA